MTNVNDSSILFTVISWVYLNLSLANEYVGDVTIPTQVIEYNQNFLQADQPIRLHYSNQIKLYINNYKLRKHFYQWEITGLDIKAYQRLFQFILLLLFY